MTISEFMKTHLIESTEEVFQTMVTTPVAAGVPMEDSFPHAKADVVATVALTGPLNAIVAFHTTSDVAKTITSSLLGIAEDEVNGEMPDAIGEVTNMIAGTFRNRMAADGRDWAISIPSVAVGTELTMKYRAGIRRILCPFSMGEQSLFIELVLQVD